ENNRVYLVRAALSAEHLDRVGYTPIAGLSADHQMKRLFSGLEPTKARLWLHKHRIELLGPIFAVKYFPVAGLQFVFHHFAPMCSLFITGFGSGGCVGIAEGIPDLGKFLSRRIGIAREISWRSIRGLFSWFLRSRRRPLSVFQNRSLK